MSHPLYMNQPFSFLPSIILIIDGGRYNLWSYTLCSFLQYPITCSHKSVRTDQHSSQTHSTAFPQCHSQSVTPTAIKILCKHTHTFTFKFSCYQKAGSRANLYEAVVGITRNYFPLNFFILLSLFLNATPKYFKFPNLPKLRYPSRIYNKSRNVAHQCTTSL